MNRNTGAEELFFTHKNVIKPLEKPIACATHKGEQTGRRLYRPVVVKQASGRSLQSLNEPSKPDVCQEERRERERAGLFFDFAKHIDRGWQTNSASSIVHLSQTC